MGQAFISYSRRDKDKVYAICNILADAGFPHWLDKEDIPPSEQWRAKIVEGIKNSGSFVLFISPAAISSPNVVAELNIASEQEHKGKLKIIPVLLTPTILTNEVEYQLSGIQWIDFSEDFTAGLKNLLSTLGNLSLPKGYKKHLLGYLPGTYITPDRISPLPQPSKEVVVGKTITIKHIQDQRFMQRPKILANLIDQLASDIKAHEKNKAEEIFTFWIHGRSGSGKSVLLLQLMQEIVLKKNAQAFWFYSDEGEKLYDFFEKWASQGIDLNEPVYAFIDDFNTPLTRDLIENKSLSSLLRNPSYSNINWPIIVTCSPPEYLQDFRNGGKDEGFRIRDWEVPTIGAEESKELIEWFELRTGRKTKTGKAFEQSEGLALSMLFELWYYSQYSDAVDTNEDVMKAFGLRFKTRLENLDLTDAIAPLLALNRLYIWPPNGWLEDLSTKQRDAFNLLISDKDFSILSFTPSSSGYIRLTHPHLSDVIYQAIRPKYINKITRVQDLVYSFEKALKTNLILANQLVRVIAEKITDDKDRLGSEEIDSNELTKGFAETWLVQKANIAEDNRSLLAYLWTNWAIWNSKKSKLSEYIGEGNIVGKALFYLGYQHRLWGELWQTLWTIAPENKQLSEAATKWLLLNRDKSGWSFVWRALLEHSHDLPESTSLKALLDLGVQWLSGREEKDQWSFVWRILLDHPNDLPEGTSLKALLDLGVHWLIGREEKDSWSFIYERCLQNGISDTLFLSLGVDWISTNTKRPETFGIVIQIVKYSEKLCLSEKFVLQNWIKNWVYKSPIKHKSWTYGWDAYWQLMPTVETADLALKWIETNENNNKGSIWVIKELLRANRTDINIRIIRWYEKHPHHPVGEIIKKKLGKQIAMQK